MRAATVLNRGGMSTGFEAAFSGHRLVEGVLFAFREENYAGGSRTATTAIEKVTLNPSLASGEFAP